MFYLTVVHSYRMICKEAGVDGIINGIDVLLLLDESATLLVEQYSKRKTENFDAYYNYKK